MRKLVLKTAFITLGVVIVLAVAAFGIASLCVPAAMSDLAYSLGMDLMSADYAYQEYERSGDLAYLARSFELTATNGRDGKAEERFDLLYAADGFEALCLARDEASSPVTVGGEEITYSYRDYICGLGACVKYRLAADDASREEALSLALSETESEFPAGNPVYMLATQAAGNADSAFCVRILQALEEGGFEKNGRYENLVNILEVIVDEQNR